VAGTDRLDELRAGGKPALARALAAIEARPDAESTLELLDAAWAAPRAHVIGLTGPPGVGKSTLTAALVRAWRGEGRTVGVIAVDPSSRRSGGALLGDRTRIGLDPEDEGVFLRSMAARDRLGGLAELTLATMLLMRAIYDRVLVETVGAGQSETDIADLADTVLLAVQPAAGDTLQHIKAGIAEIPDIAVVTKADLGTLAERTARDLSAARRLRSGAGAGWQPPVIRVSAMEGEGIAELGRAIEAHVAHLDCAGRLARRRAAAADRWLVGLLRAEVGRRGLDQAQRLCPQLVEAGNDHPFRRLARILGRLAAAPPPA
jgi:LAO/AO transport system kinase